MTAMRMEAEARYREYKRVADKIGFGQAQEHYIQAYNHERAFQFLCEFHAIDCTIAAGRSHPESMIKSLRAVGKLLGDESIVSTEGETIIQALGWYENLENDDNTNNTHTNNVDIIIPVQEGWVYLPTRIELAKCLARYDTLCFLQHIQRLLCCAQTLGSRYHITLSDMIYTMVEIQPSYAMHVRFKLTEARLLPELAVRLTVSFCKDEVEFFNGIFCGLPSWFVSQSIQNRQLLGTVKGNMMDVIQQCRGDGTSPTDEATLALALRSLTGLVGFFGTKLTDAETMKCIELLRTPTSERLAKLLLCLALVASDGFLKQTKEFLHAMIELVRSGVSETSMLLVMLLQTDQIDQVSEMVRRSLNMQVSIPKLGLFEMQTLFKSISTSSQPSRA